VTQALAEPPAAAASWRGIGAEVEAACDGVPDVEPGRVLAAVRGAGRMDAAALRDLVIGEAAALVPAEPGYSKVAARLLGARIRDEAASAGVTTFAE
jgi:ribonucleoside-diphosphate reductase alpha chain